MSANFLNTNRNATRYFFATTEAGEQDLSLQYGTTGGVPNLSTMSVALSGGGGSVVVNQAPQYVASQFVGGEQAVFAGTDSTYFTLSTLTSTLTGINISSDRTPGTGTACIESYGGNGALKGFEFLSRGLNSQLLSTNMNSFMITTGHPGATAYLGSDGTFVNGGNSVQQSAIALAPQTGGGGAGQFNIADLSGGNARTRWSMFKYGIETGGNVGTDFALGAYNDAGSYINTAYTVRRADGAMTIPNLSSVNGVRYPQNLLSTVGVANQTGLSVPASTPTVIYTISNPNLISSSAYLCDTAFSWQVGTPGATGTWIELGLRMGGNGGFNYDVPNYIPPGGTGGIFITNSVNQIAQMGTATQNVDIIAYHNNPTAISISTNTTAGGGINYFKMIT